MDLKKIISIIRNQSRLPTGGVTDTELADYVNMGQQHIVIKAVSADERYFEEQDTSLGFILNQREYNLPDNLRDVVISLVERTDLDTPSRLREINFQRREEYDTTSATLDLNFGGYYYLRGQRIGILPTPSETIANNLQISYVRKVADLSYGTVASGTSTTLKLPTSATAGTTSRVNDYYNGELVSIISGTGIGQIRTVSDYDGANRLLTLSAAWTTTPLSTSQYSFISPIPERFHEILVSYAQARVYRKNQDRDGYQMEIEHFGNLLQQFIQSIETRTVDEPKYINITGDNTEEYS